jgi:hypothetical protein
VLEANQEVEDALVAFLQNQERVKALVKAARETQQAMELELIRFKEGETDFTGVFVLQGDLVRKQDQLAEAQGNVVTSLVAVYKALGGGWEIRCPDFTLQEVVSQPVESIETVPTPEAMPPLPEPSENPNRDPAPVPPEPPRQGPVDE